MVTLSINNKISLTEAAKYIGCSRSSITKAVKSNKLKVFKVNGQNFYDQADIAKAKESGMIKGKGVKPRLTDITSGSSVLISSNIIKVQFEFNKEDFDLIALALKQGNKTVTQFINEKIKDYASQVRSALGSIQE